MLPTYSDSRSKFIEKFHTLESKIDAMSAHISSGSEFEILTNLVEPKPEMKWYQTAALVQANSLLKKEYFDTLKSSFITDLSLLYTTRCLHRESGTYIKLLHLHELSTDLFHDQIVFNEQFERQMLEQSRVAQEALEELRDHISGNCRLSFTVIPEGFLEICNQIVNNEFQQSIALFGAVESESTLFLERLTSFENSIQENILELTRVKERVLKLITSLKKIQIEKRHLAKREQDYLQKYNDYEEIKKREESKKEVIWVKERVGLFCTRNVRRVLEVNLGSSRLKEECFDICADLERIKILIHKSEETLKSDLKNHGVNYSTKTELDKASTMLSNALSVVMRMKANIYSRKLQSEMQVQDTKCRLMNHLSGRLRIRSISQAVNYLEELIEKIVFNQMMWLQSYKQSCIIQSTISKSFRLRCLIRLDVEKVNTLSTSGLEVINKVLNPLLIPGRINPMIAKLPSDESLLVEHQLMLM